MRRTGGKADGKLLRYLKVRIDMLREERNKTESEQTHLILDKGIVELTYVLELIERSDRSI
jgi:hypothetical protein